MRFVAEYSKMMVLVEHCLLKWINRRPREGISISGPEIQDQARFIYEAKEKKLKITKPLSFTASRSWLHRLKSRAKVRHAVYHGGVQSADVETASSLPHVAQQIIRIENCSLKKVYNCDAMGVYWKSSPPPLYIHLHLREASQVSEDGQGPLYSSLDCQCCW